MESWLRKSRYAACDDQRSAGEESTFSASSVPPRTRTVAERPIQRVRPTESTPPFSMSTPAVPPLFQSLRSGSPLE